MQFFGARMQAQMFSNFADGFHKTVWNLVKSLEVVLPVGREWQMELAAIFQYKPCTTNHLMGLLLDT